MLWYLRHVPFLQTFAPEAVEHLADVAIRRDLKRGKPVYIEGDRSDRVYFACGGRVRSTMISNRGQVLTLAHYGPGELFGECGLSGDGPREHSAWTTSPAIIAELPMAVFVDALRDSPDVLLAFAALTSRRRRALEKRLADLVLRDVKAKFAGLLLDLVGEFGRACEGGGTLIDIVRTHQEFADDIGATRETVSMTLAGFRRDGLVANQGRNLVITDASRLSAITGSNMGRTR
jgi:CRP-like cAMP-binding protein